MHRPCEPTPRRSDANVRNRHRGHPQGVLPAGVRRRPARLGGARPVLRRLARLPRDPRRRDRHALRRLRERVARRGRLAELRPRRELGALERGPLVRRRRRPQAVEGLRADGRARAPPRRRRGGGRVREPRRRRDLVAQHHARRAAGPRRVEHPDEPAARPPRPSRDPSAPRRGLALLGDRPGLRHLRDHRRRRVVDASQQGPARRLAAREPGGRLLRPQARDVARRHRPPLPAEPRRHAPQRRRGSVVGRDHARACRPSSALRRPRTRTTATRST